MIEQNRTLRIVNKLLVFVSLSTFIGLKTYRRHELSTDLFNV